MTTATVVSHPAGLVHRRRSAAARLLRSECTKIRSVRSTTWSIAVLVVAAIGLNTLVVGVAIANWNTTSAATKQTYLADPTGFLAAAIGIAQIPLCVLAVLVITSEYSTGMIRTSILAVPRRIPMLAAKAAVVAALAFAIGEVVAFASFLIAQPIIGHHLPESLSDASTLRAVAGVGLYLTVLALFGFAIGAIIRHTGGAITAVVGLVVVARALGGLLPGSVGQHVSAYLPANAGLQITHAHQEVTDLLSPWQGLGVFCLWTLALLAVAAFLLARRDA
jgi:ABC-2 type transport system permease protein